MSSTLNVSELTSGVMEVSAEETSVDSVETLTEENIFKKRLLENMANPMYKMNVSALVCTLFSEYVEVEVHAGMKKHLSYSSFKDIINRSLNAVSSEPTISGMLPPSNMFFLSQSESMMRIMCYYPGGNREMLYNTKKLTIVTPNIIICHTLRKDKEDWIIKQDSHFFCTDLPISKLPRTFITQIDKTKGIYLLPMSNTYEAGNMCYGNNSMPTRFKDNNFRGLDWYYTYLWTTPFNDDLGIKAIGSSIRVSEWYGALVNQAKANKPFPYKDLYNYRAVDGSPAGAESVLSNR